jgi:hypothetical protein
MQMFLDGFLEIDFKQIITDLKFLDEKNIGMQNIKE